MSFSIRLTDTEKALAESYAKLHAISLGEAFEEAYAEYQATPTTYSHEEFWNDVMTS